MQGGQLLENPICLSLWRREQEGHTPEPSTVPWGLSVHTWGMSEGDVSHLQPGQMLS